MNPLVKAWHKVRRWIENRFEAVIFSTSRSSIFSQLQDTRLDVSAHTRKELQRLHRDAAINSELVQRIRNLVIQFAVGSSGLQITPASEDQTWNEARTANWEAWARQPEVSSRLCLEELQIQWAGELFDDGEFFIVKIQDSAVFRGRPMIQTIQAHRCYTPPELQAQEGKTIIDGIEFANGLNRRPTAYYFQDDTLPLNEPKRGVTFRKVPAESVIHKFRARWPGQVRGIPDGFCTLNTLRDYRDLQTFEMRAAKKLASIANVITNETGEHPNPAALRSLRLSQSGTNTSGETVTRARSSYYEDKLGGETVFAMKGETVQQFPIDRPGVAQQNFWDTLTTFICCGYNVPKLLVFPYSLQGTVTRADLEVCTQAFRFNFEIIAAAVREIYEWEVRWAVNFDLSMDGETPEHFERVVIRPPRSPNVDIGRNAQALATERELGVTTFQDVCAERQQDWRRKMRESAEAAAYAAELAREFGVTPDNIMKMADGQSPAAALPAEAIPATAATADIEE